MANSRSTVTGVELDATWTGSSPGRPSVEDQEQTKRAPEPNRCQCDTEQRAAQRPGRCTASTRTAICALGRCCVHGRLAWKRRNATRASMPQPNGTIGDAGTGRRAYAVALVGDAMIGPLGATTWVSQYAAIMPNRRGRSRARVTASTGCGLRVADVVPRGDHHANRKTVEDVAALPGGERAHVAVAAASG